MAGRHKGDTKEFCALTFAEQAKSITATINDLQAAIEHPLTIPFKSRKRSRSAWGRWNGSGSTC